MNDNTTSDGADPFESISAEYATPDPDSICGYDHDAMLKEILRLRALRLLVAEYMITPNDIGRVHIMRALMQSPEVAL